MQCPKCHYAGNEFSGPFEIVYNWDRGRFIRCARLDANWQNLCDFEIPYPSAEWTSIVAASCRNMGGLAKE